MLWLKTLPSDTAAPGGEGGTSSCGLRRKKTGALRGTDTWPAAWKRSQSKSMHNYTVCKFHYRRDLMISANRSGKRYMYVAVSVPIIRQMSCKILAYQILANNPIPCIPMCNTSYEQSTQGLAKLTYCCFHRTKCGDEWCVQRKKQKKKTCWFSSLTHCSKCSDRTNPTDESDKAYSSIATLVTCTS